MFLVKDFSLKLTTPTSTCIGLLHFKIILTNTTSKFFLNTTSMRIMIKQVNYLDSLPDPYFAVSVVKVTCMTGSADIPCFGGESNISPLVLSHEQPHKYTPCRKKPSDGGSRSYGREMHFQDVTKMEITYTITLEIPLLCNSY